MHVKLTDEQRTQVLTNTVGLPEDFAKFLTYLEVLAANGSEDVMNDVVEQVTGRPPQKFDAFAQENKAAWE